MKKLSLFAMAASSTVLIPAAMAQAAAPNPDQGAHRPGGGAVAQHRVPQAGHSWRQGTRPQTRHVAPPQVRHRGGRMEMRQHHGMKPAGQHGGGFAHVRRIDRGGMLPHAWFGPRYHVRNWNLYGFSQPFGGGHWVRYYDDALLVDPYGRVLDGRYGVNWDVEGERWDYDDNGVPAYVGEGDFQPGQDDYEWAEDYARGNRDEGFVDDAPGDERPGERGRRYTYAYPGYAPPGYDCNCTGYGYGYGYGPVLVTETIVTTAPVMESVTRYEYVKERPAHRKVRPVYRSKDRKAVRRSK
ncbi:RcnB family protein [Sphingosinicella rhizophila]|uniref:RcnB family protein n=1 Tax=Sphingosinicella rhizophila TaxID=3050082 RepID=A0ABU3Q4T1_9SPHN|nr:RcnB family protein [Sphingosinicella sp. GR2756]MDT9597973.1 RcnB family protein [Sphingosinicella sp. GR2756]